MGMAAKAIAYYRRHGLGGLLRRCVRPLRRLRRWVWRRQRYVIAVKSIRGAEPPAEHADVTFREATHEDAGQIAEQFAEHFGPDGQALVVEALDAGDRAIIGVSAEDGRTIVCISWLSRRDALLRTLLGGQIGAEDICHRRLFVPAEFRRRHLAAREVQFVEPLAGHSGVERIWGFIETANEASQKLMERLGYDVHGLLEISCFLGRRRARVRRQGQKTWQRLDARYA